jgi:hypothetical protein
VVIRGHAFMQNLQRGHYELRADARHERFRLIAAVDELAEAKCPSRSINATTPSFFRPISRAGFFI